MNSSREKEAKINTKEKKLMRQLLNVYIFFNQIIYKIKSKLKIRLNDFYKKIEAINKKNIYSK